MRKLYEAIPSEIPCCTSAIYPNTSVFHTISISNSTSYLCYHLVIVGQLFLNHLHCSELHYHSLIIPTLAFWKFILNLRLLQICWKKFHLIGERANERDTYRGNTIENRGCLLVYIYVWTYVCHFVLWPSRIFVLAQCSIPSPTSLNSIPWFIDHYTYHPRNWIVYRFEFFCGYILNSKSYWSSISIRVSGSGKLISYLS